MLEPDTASNNTIDKIMHSDDASLSKTCASENRFARWGPAIIALEDVAQRQSLCKTGPSDNRLGRWGPAIIALQDGAQR